MAFLLKPGLHICTAAAAFLLCLSAPMPAQAGSCGYEYCWGALAVGPNGASGRATSMRTAPGAQERAEAACGGKCDRVEMFVNTCAALAGDRTGRTVRALGGTRDIAESAAMALCAETSPGCRVLVWGCSK